MQTTPRQHQRTTATDQLLTTESLCELYPVFNVNTLAYWRQIGAGPRWARLGKRIAYRKSDVEAWIEEQFAAAK